MSSAAQNCRLAAITMTTILIACGAVLAVIAVAATVFLLGRRSEHIVIDHVGGEGPRALRHLAAYSGT